MPIYEATAVILAGGKSSRLGFDKQLLAHDGRYVMDDILEKLKLIFEEVIIVSNTPLLHEGRNCRIISDTYLDAGPLGGIQAGLSAATYSTCFFTACDMPWISEDYINYLMQHKCTEPEIEILVTRQGTMVEPLSGLYDKRLLERVEDLLKAGHRRIQSLLKTAQTDYIPERVALKYSPDWSMFANINTPDDLARFYETQKGAERRDKITHNLAFGG